MTKVGICLPVFVNGVDRALEVASSAEAAGLDGVFVYDHLFPLRAPHRPAFSCLPMLSAVAALTDKIVVGSLVARVGLLPPEVIAASFETLSGIAPGRIIAALGTGDHMTLPEVAAYGLPFGSVDERVGWLAQTAELLKRVEVPVWLAGNHHKVRELCACEICGWVAWDISTDSFSSATAEMPSSVWAGPPPHHVEIATHLGALASLNASWVIYAPVPSINWGELISELAAVRLTINS